MHRSFFMLFSKTYLRRTIFNSLYLIVSLVGLWAGSVYVPTAMTYIAMKEGRAAVEAAQLASYSSALLGIGTVLGALLVPPLADRLGRKPTLGIFFAFMGGAIWLAFGHVFYLNMNASALVSGLFFSARCRRSKFHRVLIWLPEQIQHGMPRERVCVQHDIGRFAAAGMTFLVGAGISL